jgi:hypothetical protein
MNRCAEDMLADWAKQDQRKPMVLRDARQTGKTWLVKHFAERFQGDLAYVNLEREPDLGSCFAPRLRSVPERGQDISAHRNPDLQPTFGAILSGQ